MKVRSSRKNRVVPIVRIAIIALVFVGTGVLLPKLFNLVGSVVMAPVHTFNNWLETSSQTFPVFVRSRNSLEAEIKQLEQDLVVSESSKLTVARLVTENQSLRSLLNADSSKRTAAAVVARPSDLPYDLLEIDQGWESGIKEGAAVYVGTDQFIGVVTQVARTHSFVELLTSPGFEATVFIEGPDVVATLEGYGGGVARVKVPQGIALTVGDLVHVLSIEPGVYGRISYIETTPSQPEQYGYISPELPLRSIHYVAVESDPIKPTDEEEAYRRVDSILQSLIIEGVDTVDVPDRLATTTASTTP